MTGREALRVMGEALHARRCTAPHRTPDAHERCVVSYVDRVDAAFDALDRAGFAVRRG